jgi:hypothetical protein
VADLSQYAGASALAEAKSYYPGIPFILVAGALDKDPEKVGEMG